MQKIEPCNEFYPGVATGIIEASDLILTYTYDRVARPKDGEKIEYKGETYTVIKTALRHWQPSHIEEIEVLLRKV